MHTLSFVHLRKSDKTCLYFKKQYSVKLAYCIFDLAGHTAVFEDFESSR